MNTLRVLTAKLPLIHTSVRHYYLKPRRSSNSNSQALLLAAGVVTGLFGCSVYFLGKCLCCCCCCCLIIWLGRPDEETEYLGKFEQQKYTNCEFLYY